jgi:hypothetical protein
MPKNEPTVKIKQFLGLRNLDEPVRLPAGSLVDTKNIDIDDSGGIERRVGYTALAGFPAVTAVYATIDERELYVVDGGILKKVLSVSPLTVLAMAIDIGPGEVWWAENGGHIFCSGALNGIIHAGTFTPYSEWGSDDEQIMDAQGLPLYRDEADIGTDAPPQFTECVAFFEGCVWLSYFDTVAGQSFIFRSKPFFWSRWDLANDYIAVPGRVLLLAAPGNRASAMVIGTDQEIHSYSQGQLGQLADWGAVAGQADEFRGKAYFWTQEGLCRAFPFEAMTEPNVYVPHGTRAALVVSKHKAYEQAIVITQGA